MRSTRLQTNKRVRLRKQVVEKIKANMAARPTTTRASSSAQDSAEATDPAGVFPLLSLPAEIQNMVFEYVVADPDSVLMLENVTTPPLARVNRYFRKTVLPIFVRAKTFHIITDRESGFYLQGSVMEWFGSLGHDTPLVQDLVVHFGAEMEHELLFQYSRKPCGLTVNINNTSRFWAVKLDTDFSAFSREYVDYLTHGPGSFPKGVGSVGELCSSFVMQKFGKEVLNQRDGLVKRCQAISMTDIMWLERAKYDAPVVDVVTLLQKIEMVSMALHQSPSRRKHVAIAFFASIGSDE